MTTPNQLAEYNRLKDAAKQRAGQLRREAIEGFWNEAGHAARQALRAANRFAHSLERHARLRKQQGA